MAKKVYNRVKELIAEKERRTEESISNRDVANATGLSKNTVNKWVRNKNQTYDREVMSKFLEYFGCTISDLIVYEQSIDEK